MLEFILGKDRFEKLFFTAATHAGFHVGSSPSIRCNQPVTDRRGGRKKVVTHPDFLVKHPHHLNRYLYIEVTSGNGDAPSKHAQRRVVEAAGMAHVYFVVSRTILEKLATQTPKQNREYLCFLFCWEVWE